VILSVGDKVSYPCQGPCLVGPVVERVVDGKPTEFYHLIVLGDAGGDLFIPVDDQAPSRGVRRLLDRSEIPKVLERLQRAAGAAKNWKRRAIDNSKLFATGSAFDLAEIVESLSGLAETKPLSPGDRQTLQRARKLLVCEISEVTGAIQSVAEAQIDGALKVRKDA